MCSVTVRVVDVQQGVALRTEGIRRVVALSKACV